MLPFPVGLHSAVAGGGGPWTPADLGTGLIGFYDADDTASITAPGGNVSAWNSGSGTVHYGQPTSASRGTYSATSFAGGPGITLSGGKWMRAPVTLNGGPELAAFVHVILIGPFRDVNARVISYQRTGAFHDIFEVPSAGMLAYGSTDGGAGSPTPRDLRAYRDSIPYATTGLVPFDVPLKVGTVFDGTNVKTYVDNVQKNSQARTGNFGTGGNLLLTTQSSTQPGAPANVNFKRIVWVNRAPTTDERANIFDWL
jgi:hypothetical protein